MDSTQFTTGDVSSKQLPRARDQISQLVVQFPSDFREGASYNSSVAEQQKRNKKMQGLRKTIAPR